MVGDLDTGGDGSGYDSLDCDGNSDSGKKLVERPAGASPGS